MSAVSSPYRNSISVFSECSLYDSLRTTKSLRPRPHPVIREALCGRIVFDLLALQDTSPLLLKA